MNRTSNLNKLLDNEVFHIENQLKLYTTDFGQVFHLDLFIKNAIKDITNKNNAINLNPEGEIIKDLITIVDGQVDYKDIIMSSINLTAKDIINLNIVKFLEDIVCLKPIVISDSILKFANIYQYNNYLSNKKDILKCPDKYKDITIIKKVIDLGYDKHILEKFIPNDFKCIV